MKETQDDLEKKLFDQSEKLKEIKKEKSDVEAKLKKVEMDFQTKYDKLNND